MSFNVPRFRERRGTKYVDDFIFLGNNFLLLDKITHSLGLNILALIFLFINHLEKFCFMGPATDTV